MDELVCEMINDLENNNIHALEEKNKLYNKNKHCLLQKLIDLESDKVQPVVIENFDGISGLWYIKNYLTRNEIKTIKDAIDNKINLEAITAENKYSRRVAHFGYYYSYNHTGLKVAPKIPSLLKKLVTPERINTLIGSNIIPEFEQVIINEYKPNQQIAYHTDHVKFFGPVIACITIGQQVPIYFKLNDMVKKLNVEEGSLYLMTGDARYKWLHSLKNTGQSIRYSLTYRTINKN